MYFWGVPPGTPLEIQDDNAKANESVSLENNIVISFEILNKIGHLHDGLATNHFAILAKADR